MVIQDTLESFLVDEAYDFIKNFSTNSVTFMNDVHYYLPSLPASTFDSSVYVTGLLFEANTGVYNLPCNEGVYKVYSREGV